MFKKKVHLKYRIMVNADYATVKTKFLKQGAHVEEINEYFDLFRKLSNKNKIKIKEERNIDYWGKKQFNEFKEFVNKLEGTRTKSEQKRMQKMEGAELVAENNDYYVYHITNHAAAMMYGSGTKWCITQSNGHYWNQYSARNNFYFFIAKHKDDTDPLYKVAMTVDRNGKKTYWNAEDHQEKAPPTKVDYKFKTKEVDITVEGLFERLKSEYKMNEDHYNTVDAYMDMGYDEYIYNFELDKENVKKHLTNSAEDLVDKLYELVGSPDTTEFKRILLNASDLKLEHSMYYATNEIAGVKVGDQQPEISEDIKEDIGSLSDKEKEDLQNMIHKSHVVYTDNKFNHYYVGSDYARLVYILDEDKLEDVINDLEKYREKPYVPDKEI